jgi:hypothetical protein
MTREPSASRSLLLSRSTLRRRREPRSLVVRLKAFAQSVERPLLDLLVRQQRSGSKSDGVRSALQMSRDVRGMDGE